MRLFCAVVLALLLPAAASAKEQNPTRDCFISSAWRGWSAPQGADALYMRVHTNDIYRVDLAPGTRIHRYGSDFLVNQVRGSSWVCSALDLDLALVDYNGGFHRGIVATNLRKLTSEEVAALPREDLPY